MPTLSIIIPVYNQEQFTAQILEDIPKKIKSDYELIIIDNGSDEPTRELLKNTEATVVRFATNQYVTKAWNVGASIARGEYLMFLNNDILLSNWIDRVLIDWDDGQIQSPLLTNHWSTPMTYATNINGTCFLLRRDKWIPIPETMRIWYNDDWLFFTHWTKWNHDCEVVHFISKTVNSIRDLQDIGSRDKEAFISIAKEKWWNKHY